MEILRYIIVFFTVGWGCGIIEAILFVLIIPLICLLRGTTARGGVVAVSNGVATLLALYLAHLACSWTGGQATLLMFGIAFWALLSNDLRRIKRAKGGIILGRIVEDENFRVGMVQTEKMNLIADVVGFSAGLALIPRLEFM